MKKKQVVYMGEVLKDHGFSQSIFQRFRDKEGKFYHYVGIKRIWPGSTYQMEPGDKMNIRPERIYDSDLGLTEAEEIEMEAQKIAVRQYRASRRKEMDLKKPHTDIVRAIALLSPFVRSLPRFDQDRFLKYIFNEASKTPKKRKTRI